MTQFTYEFRWRSLVGVAILTASIIAIAAFAHLRLPNGVEVIACSLFVFITICSTLGIVTDHRVGSSLDGEQFRWWSKRGFFPFTRSVPLKNIDSVFFVNGKGGSRRTFLRLELKDGKTINVATHFFLDGATLLKTFRAMSPEITVASISARDLK